MQAIDERSRVEGVFDLCDSQPQKTSLDKGLWRVGHFKDDVVFRIHFQRLEDQKPMKRIENPETQKGISPGSRDEGAGLASRASLSRCFFTFTRNPARAPRTTARAPRTTARAPRAPPASRRVLLDEPGLWLCQRQSN